VPAVSELALEQISLSNILVYLGLTWRISLACDHVLFAQNKSHLMANKPIAPKV